MRNDWDIRELKDICEIGDGNYSSKYPKASEFTSIGIPFLTATNLKGGTITRHGMRYISKEQHSKLTKGHVKEGDLVVVVRGSSTGNSSLVPDEYENSNLNSQLAFLRSKKRIVKKKYLHYVFSSPDIQRVVSDTISGSAQPQLPNNKLLGIRIPVPPLSEQKQIVKILDEALAAIEQAKENIEKNIGNAKELFQSKLNGIFSQKGEGWEEKTLGEVAKYDKEKYSGEDLPYVGLEHIESATGIYLGTTESHQVRSSTFKFSEKHVLYGRLRPYLNKVLVPRFEGHCSTEIIPVLPDKSISRNYLFYWFMSPKVVSKLDATSTGARMPRANMKEVLGFSLLVPPLVVQEDAVSQLSSLKQQLREYEQKSKERIDALEELRSTILQKAFSGELTQKEIEV